MCGIAGIIDPNLPTEQRVDIVERMCAAMVHRGPDDKGLESKGPATLGMRRLAIFDPANGHQPMVTPDGRLTLVFNGSIVNFKALREELRHSWTFRTECDTEVLLAAFARWGQDCLGKLRGMFAFAVWDAQEHTLCVARDPFGIKPLYYRQDGNRLVFGSEINALIAGGTEAEIDPLSVADYLAWFSVPAPKTIYKGIFSLRPGEAGIFHQGRLRIRRAWTFGMIPKDVPRCSSRPEFVRELRSRLEDTIHAHAVADVPVGAFLSGGIDSAVVVGLMTRAGGAPLRTFSIGFDESGFSEAESAETNARRFGAEHHASVLSGKEVASDIEKFISACDQPTGDGLNTYYVSRAARAGGVTVALSGLGGDELFGGYPSFKYLSRFGSLLPLWRAVPRSLRHRIIRLISGGDTRSQKLADMLHYARDIHGLAALQRQVFSEPARRSLLSREVRGHLGTEPPYHPEYSALKSDLAGAGGFEIASAWELRTYMADLLLRDSDVMSMRHSLELRVPFVDRPFIEWLWRQPAAFKYSPDHPKRVLAESVADLIPPGLLTRRKRGFTLPISVWMRRELRPFLDETLSESSLGRSGFLDGANVRSAWRGFLDHDDTREWSRLWSLAVLVAFVNNRHPVPAPALERTGGSASIGAAPVKVAESKILHAAEVAQRVLAPVPPAPPARRRPATLLMAPEIFSQSGGIPRILQLYLRALWDLGVAEHRTVRLIALNDPMLDSTDLRRTIDGPLDDWMVCGRNKTRFVRGAWKMSRGCDRIICGHFHQLPVAWAVHLLRPKVRYYLVAHGIEVWRRFRFAERVALRGAARIFCVSQFTREELLRNCPMRESRVVVLPNALDPFFKIENGVPLAQCPPTILTVTRLNFADRYKGVEHMIAAMPAIRATEPAAQLRVVGRGDDLPRLQSLARQHGLLGNGIEFLGYLDDRRLSEEFKRCRLFALPSRKEGFGLVFLEAMAHGRPCVGARAGGIPEVITEDTGCLVQFGDVPGLAIGCVAALKREWREESILARARKFSYPQFKDMLGSYLSV